MSTIFQHHRRVRYVEVDAQAVVYNAHYLTWFDEAITEYMREIGLDIVPSRDQAFDYHVVKCMVEYQSPIGFDETIVVTVEPTHVGNSSIKFQMRVLAADGDRRAKGEVIWVYTDQNTGKSSTLPDEVRQKIGSGSAANPPA